MAQTKMALNDKTALQVGTATPADVQVRTGLDFERYFTDGRTPPFDAVEWERRVALIGNEKGKTIFRQEDVEVPKGWSQTATNIVASKYFHGKLNTPERENSVRQLIGRVVNTIVGWGEKGGYFASAPARDAFRDELTHLLVEQKMAFNSPVWFNVGVQPKPQCSACFINSVQDDMESIMNLAKTEGMLFKWGSGTGTNFSSLRGSRETLSGGGIASGPVSFMKGFDAFAGVIKSGGKTRRAAKMVILNADHPDIVDFIDSKMKEERKARVLIEQGYDPSIDGEAYSSIFFQNANHSVRVTDEFMQAVEDDRDWWTRNVNDGNPVEKFSARELLHRMAESTWQCGDPGMQYDTTVNRWHTCKNYRAHQRLESVLGIHVPGRHGVQPRVAQPDEVSEPQWLLRRRSVPPRRGHHHHGAGNPGGQRQLPDAPNRREFAQVPPAGPRLRQSGRAADVHGAAL